MFPAMLVKFAGAVKGMSSEMVEEGITDQQYKATVIVLMMAVVLILGIIMLAVLPFALAVVPATLFKGAQK
jgi:hypothetical protein